MIYLPQLLYSSPQIWEPRPGIFFLPIMKWPQFVNYSSEIAQLESGQVGI